MKTRKLKSWKSDNVPHTKMILRMVEVRPETADDERKSVEVVIATENPVERWDDERGEVVQEILLMDGVEFRNSRRQLPIVDAHDRSSVRNVLGSIRDIGVINGQLVGRAEFARDHDSQTAYQKILDGHLTDFSITATPRQVRRLQRGETTNVGGRDVTGPADLIDRWTPTDASLVPVGADETATVRDVLRSYDAATWDEDMKRELTDELKGALVEKGMPEQISNEGEALAWALGILGTGAPAEEETVEMAEGDAPEEEEETTEDEVANMDEDEKKPEEVTKAIGRALKADRERQREIRALFASAGIERAVADDLCDSGATVNAARKKLIDEMVARQSVPTTVSGIRFTASSQEKTYEAMRDGLIQRAFQGAGIKAKPFEKAAPGAEDFRYMGLKRLGESWLRRMGVNTERMPDQDIAKAALGVPSVLHRYQIQRDAYHTTGSFPQLMLDASNKTLLAAYDEAPYTWSMWARQAASVPDFKNVNRIRFSEAPDMQVVPELHAYPEGAMSDQKETYVVEKYGQTFSVSWETVVNDDLDAISRVPAMHGNAARRKQNKVVYQVLFNNPTMSDGVALFGSHSSGTNLDGSGAAPSVAELNAAFVAMMTQKGLNSSVSINIQPRYLIAPVALSATVLQLLGSLSDPLAGGASTTGNSNTLNIYGPNGTRPLQPVIDPVLDGNSATAWYLAADVGQVDTVELAFLQGEESPVLESEWDFDHDCYKYKIRQTFGAAAIDWRGLFKNPGT